jgi:hypothetical protein
MIIFNIIITIKKMLSIEYTIFVIKQNYHKTIKQHAKVRIISIINDYCLVEDIETLNRLWIAKYEIYPINNVYLGGWWQQSKYYDNLYKEMGLMN